MAETSKNARQIEVVGPVDKTSGARVFILPRDGKEDDLRVVPDQILTVGTDLSAKEADYLLTQSTWKFREVK